MGFISLELASKRVENIFFPSISPPLLRVSFADDDAEEDDAFEEEEVEEEEEEEEEGEAAKAAAAGVFNATKMLGGDDACLA